MSHKKLSENTSPIFDSHRKLSENTPPIFDGYRRISKNKYPIFDGHRKLSNNTSPISKWNNVTVPGEGGTSLTVWETEIVLGSLQHSEQREPVNKREHSEQREPNLFRIQVIWALLGVAINSHFVMSRSHRKTFFSATMVWDQ